MMQEWFQKAKLGIFIHWGIYAVEGVSESWSFFNGEISHEDYMAQLAGFTAEKYDPKEWAKLFKKAGAKYSVLTSKHHDGVALWDTQLSDLSVVKSSPAKRDLMGPFCEALREEELKVGIYFSHLDWSHKDYPTVFKHHQIPGLNEKRNHFSVPEGDHEDLEGWQRFLEFHRGQLGELMQNYSPDLLWFDGDWERDAEQWDMKGLRDFLHQHKSDVILNSRMSGYGDYKTPEQAIPVSRPEGVWEFCMTINDSWGYRQGDHNYKSIRKIIRIFSQCISMGGNLLLDIGPKPDGTIDERQEQILLQLGDWIRPNAEAIYNTKAGLDPRHFLGGSTLSEDLTCLYLFVYDRPWEMIEVKGIWNEIESVTLLNNGKELPYIKGNTCLWAGLPDILEIQIQEEDLDQNVTVIKVQMKDQLKLYVGEGHAIEAN